jgi:hypothetical protein
MSEIQAKELADRIEEYRRKWRSNGYPVTKSYIGDDGYMVVPGYEKGWHCEESTSGGCSCALWTCMARDNGGR